jgi:hypothetical protein
VIPTERNYVLNPGHPEFRAIRVRTPESFAFDLTTGVGALPAPSPWWDPRSGRQATALARPSPPRAG